MELNIETPQGKIESKDDKIRRIHELESQLAQSSSWGKGRDLFYFILYKIYGTPSKQMMIDGMDHFSKYDNINLSDLLKEYRAGMRMPTKIANFDEWLNLVTTVGNLKGKTIDGDSKLEITPHNSVAKTPALKASNDLVEQGILLAQKEQEEIEKNLAEALNSYDSGLKITIEKEENKDKKKDKNYGLPKYHYLISSKNGVKLGMIQFSIEEKNNEDVNILKFVQFITNDLGEKSRVVMTLSNMKKRQIEIFTQQVLVALGGKKRQETFKHKDNYTAAA